MASARRRSICCESALLQEHITPALSDGVRRGAHDRAAAGVDLELDPVLDRVVLRAPKALTQALVDSLEGGIPTYRGSRRARSILSALSRSAAGFFARSSSGSRPAW